MMKNQQHNQDTQQHATEENRALIIKLYKAFMGGNIPAVLADLSPKVEWTDAEGFPYAGTYTGPDTIKEKVFTRIGTEWERFEVHPSAYIADGNQVVVLGQYNATYKATGRNLTSPFAHVWQIEDGKVTYFRQFTDAPPFQRAVKQ